MLRKGDLAVASDVTDRAFIGVVCSAGERWLTITITPTVGMRVRQSHARPATTQEHKRWLERALNQTTTTEEQTMSATAQTQTIKTADVKVREGFNVRENGAPADEGIKQLAASVKLLGVLQPIILDDEGYVIAGHRRLAAAKLAGLEQIPWHPQAKADLAGSSEKGRQAAAAAENIARQQLSPAEEAKAIDRMLKAGFSERGAAQALAMTPSKVTRRLVLLKIPEQLRVLWGPRNEAKLDSATYAASLLEKVPDMWAIMLHSHESSGQTREHWHTPQIDAILTPDRYLDELYRYYGATGTARAKGQPKWPANAIFVAEGETFPSLDQALLRIPKGLKERFSAATNKLRKAYDYSTRMSVEQPDMDAARAAGALVHFPSVDLICDVAWLKERIKTDILPRFEKLAENAVQPAAATRAPAGPPRELSAAEKKAAEKAQRTRDAQKKWKGLAPGANLDLGKALLDNFSQVPLSVDVAKFFAEATLGPRPGNSYGITPAAALAAGGLRYVMPGWQTETPKPTKANPQKTVTEYLTRDEAEKKLWAWFDQAKTPEEILGRAIVIHAAARWAVENAVAESHRLLANHNVSYSGRFAEHIKSTNARKQLEKITTPKLPASVKALVKEISTYKDTP